MNDLNNKPICLVYQPLGIGDVFFCQGIGKYFLNKGYRVIWPLASQVMYLKEYINSPGIEFVNKDLDFPRKDFYIEQNPLVIEKDFVFLPLANASHRVPNSSLMYSKYELLGLDFNIWRDNFNFTRNMERENNLYYNILGLKEDEEYMFVNKKWGTPPYYNEAPFNVDTEYKVVEMQFIPGDNIFDWLKVIENASMIVTVDTSYLLLMEKLSNMKSQAFYCYPRSNNLDFIPIIEKMYSINWQYFVN
jgi:hypothetical protein